MQDALKEHLTFPIWWTFKVSWTCPQYSLDGWLLFTFKHDSLTPGSHVTSKQMTAQLFWSPPKCTIRIKTEVMTVISPNQCYRREVFLYLTPSVELELMIRCVFFFFLTLLSSHISVHLSCLYCEIEAYFLPDIRCLNVTAVLYWIICPVVEKWLFRMENNNLPNRVQKIAINVSKHTNFTQKCSYFNTQ